MSARQPLTQDGLAALGAGGLRLIPEQRREQLLQLLRREGIASIRAVTEYLGVSHMTVRRDIAALESTGQVVSVKGGVRLPGAGSTGIETSVERQARLGLEISPSSAVAVAAARRVHDGMVVYLDAGTISRAVAPLLIARRELTVVTNDFLVVENLLHAHDVEVIHTGGVLDRASRCSGGPLAALTVATINVDLCFLDTEAWSLERGVTSASPERVALAQSALRASANCVLLADSAQYGTIVKYQVMQLRELDAIITFDDLPALAQGNIRAETVELEVVHRSPDGA